ncbi:S24 family peptidase [Neisseria sp. 83E34]|uniref:S24 family peptidase n=1 Tax=Neisseria sp. 83E34 TaxID=1692264 RepID=UPI0006CE8137|nr:S24 family peptidase [Neisseria sp. 83E34]KPN71632.1 hypothetical protein AKG09_04895 [Neisseria sp. 83E34]
MAGFKLDIAQIIEISKKAKELGIASGLPSSKPGIADKAERENWTFELVPGKGGRGGMKKLYTIPRYIVEELREKGLIDLLLSENAECEPDIGSDNPQESQPANQTTEACDHIEYAAWAAVQDRDHIVPVKYYREVFACAGNGAIPWDTNPEAMWFRDSFFKYLGLKPADCFCTRVEGDSMHPTLIDQGTVLWHAVTQYTREGIYLFRQGEELRVKRLQRLNTNSLNVISDNPNKGIYPTTELDLSQAEPHDFEILGRYLWSCGIAK